MCKLACARQDFREFTIGLWSFCTSDRVQLGMILGMGCLCGRLNVF